LLINWLIDLLINIYHFIKGPILAALYAASELFRKKELFADIVFIIEGEEEAQSAGIENVIDSNLEFFGKPDVILISNTTWLG